ncbi:MAG: hypothetical protein Q9159_000872 [Coniocarpon cinnabarinum]
MICLQVALVISALGSALAQSTPPPPSLNNTDFNATDLPVVDLGYELHRALYLNETGNFYNFSNIRYAAPPLGANRFRAPQPPETNRSVIQDGSQGVICPQAAPNWELFAAQYLPAVLQGQPSNLTEADLAALNNSVSPGNIPAPDPRTTEDCLVLDVAVPKQVFDGQGSGTPAPVLVWVYGGGYTQGEKSTYPPPGLIYRSEQGGREPIIFVAMNYRLGAFGWLGGPTFQSSSTANNGLLDQRAAFEWVQNNIDKFGGDKDRVTVMGESAGGGSITHHLTAYGGRDTPPFQQAIPQSAAWQPVVSNRQTDDIYADFLTYANVSTFEELQGLSSEQVINANYLQVARSPYGQYTYGPIVDGSYVPQLPGQLFLEGDFNKQIRVLVGKNSQESVLFTDPFINSEEEFRAFIRQYFPTATESVLDYIEFTLYPAAPYSNGSLSYNDSTGRVGAVISDSTFRCNAYYLDNAYGQMDQAYGYFFEVPPGIHGQDIVYTFYDNTGVNPSSLLLNTTVAVALQDWITTFTQTGMPSAPDVQGVPNFKLYEPDSQVEDLQLSSITEISDPDNNYRCQSCFSSDCQTAVLAMATVTRPPTPPWSAAYPDAPLSEGYHGSKSRRRSVVDMSAAALDGLRSNDSQVSRSYPTALQDGYSDRGYGKSQRQTGRSSRSGSENHNWKNFARISPPVTVPGASDAKPSKERNINPNLADRLARAEDEETRAEIKRLLGDANAEPDYSEIMKDRAKAFGAKNVEVPRELLRTLPYNYGERKAKASPQQDSWRATSSKTRSPEDKKSHSQGRRDDTAPASQSYISVGKDPGDDSRSTTSTTTSPASRPRRSRIFSPNDHHERGRLDHDRPPGLGTSVLSRSTTASSYRSNYEDVRAAKQAARYAKEMEEVGAARERLRANPGMLNTGLAHIPPLPPSQFNQPKSPSAHSRSAPSVRSQRSKSSVKSGLPTKTGRYYRHRFLNYFRRKRQRRMERLEAKYRVKNERLTRRMQDKHDALSLREMRSQSKIDRRRARDTQKEQQRMERLTKTRRKLRRQRKRAYSSAEGRFEAGSDEGVDARDFASEPERYVIPT